MHLLNPTDLLKLSFGPNWVQETKTFIIYEISRMLLSNMDFSLAHFANFNFAHFVIEESFGLVWVKLQNGRFHLKFLFRLLVSSMGFIFFLILCIIEVLGKSG